MDYKALASKIHLFFYQFSLFLESHNKFIGEGD